ncbi:protoporphyrinogen/coproporphyrinogen oxidase [Zhongshania marina]|uniref:NAD(P)/FAD-dependent oxidoreductase n=1 Tax=Zhongshania marina TaxID=2304603 RepID=A0ABX9W5R3_9GAMM|nr:NAD(P)/FAD-dependent oxidoreductase [Zhongshania marina]
MSSCKHKATWRMRGRFKGNRIMPIDNKKVFVIGAGPSGLAAAWRLHRAGLNVTVLEKELRPGGQLKTINESGFLMEAGTTILPQSYSSVMGLVSEVGMLHELVPANSLIAFMRDEKLHYLRADRLAWDAARTKLFSLKSKLKVGRLALDAFKLRNLMSYEDISIASNYDVETPADYARRKGLDGEIFDYLIEPTIRGGAGVPGDVISVVEFFFLWQKVLGTKLFAFENGYSSFTDRLAANLDVRYGADVNEVVESNCEVTVRWRDSEGEYTDRADGAVVSVMGNRVPSIVPQLAEERAKFLHSLNYTSCINVNMALSRPPENCPAAFITMPRPVTPDMFALIVEHNKAPGRAPAGRGLVTMYAMNEWSVNHRDALDEKIVESLLPMAEKAIPKLGSLIEFTKVNRWYPVLVYSHPGLYKDLGKFHKSRDLGSRIHLAGSYNSSGNVNTATVAGERSARELIALLEGL